MRSKKMADIIAKIENADISVETKKTYIMHFKILEKELKQKILTDSKSTIKWITDNNTLQGRKSYISSLLGIFKHAELTEKYAEAFEKYREERRELADELTKQIDENKATTRQKNGFVSLKEITELRDKLEKGSTERLLLSFYTRIPPVRSDYGDLLIYENPPEENKGNYIVLSQEKMTVNEHKTGKFYAIETILPAELMEELRISLEKNPRKYVFGTQEDKPKSPNAYSKWTAYVLKKLFNKPLTVTILRHIYISKIDFTNTSNRELKNIAKQMGHSVSQQMQYRLMDLN